MSLDYFLPLRVPFAKNFNTLVSLKKSSTSSRNIFITHNTRILFHKSHLYKSIPFIFTCEKAYTANQNCVQLFHMWKYNQSTIA